MEEKKYEKKEWPKMEFANEKEMNFWMDRFAYAESHVGKQSPLLKKVGEHTMYADIALSNLRQRTDKMKAARPRINNEVDVNKL